MRRAAAVLFAVLLAGCASTAAVHARPAIAAAPHCGIERWAVKTGTDPVAAQVNLTAQDTTVAALGALAIPAGFSPDAPRLPGAEMQTYRVAATLTGYKLEADSDYHLVLTQTVQTSSGPKTYTMIAEIPDPACVGAGSPFADGIAQARAAFDAKYTPSSAGFTAVSVPVTVTGVGFFDVLHGQSGAAPDGFELHPVLAIAFGS